MTGHLEPNHLSLQAAIGEPREDQGYTERIRCSLEYQSNITAQTDRHCEGDGRLYWHCQIGGRSLFLPV